jgi:hypothetical protein
MRTSPIGVFGSRRSEDGLDERAEWDEVGTDADTEVRE